MPQLPSASEVSGTTKEVGKNEIFDLISDDKEEDKIELQDDKKPEKEIKEPSDDKDEVKEEKDESEEDEEEDELKELEEELEEPDEDELELITPVRRRDIIAKYPIYKQIVKDFPYLEKAYYREQKFTELYPTIQDATDAKEKSETLDKFESQLLSGDLEQIIKAVKDENKDSFNKLADNYLLAMSKVDESAYHHVIGNVIKSTIYNMVKEANAMGEKDGAVLKNSAAILNQFIFGTSTFTPAKQLSADAPEKDNKERELEEREKKFTEKKFTDVRTHLESKIDNILKATISANIDKKDVMTPYNKRNAERDALESVYNLLDRDTRFKSLRDKLWQAAHKDDFSDDSVRRIETAIRSRAKTLLPSVIQKARNEALRGMGKRVIDKENNEEESEREAPERTRTTTSSSNRGLDKTVKKGDIPTGMSNKDFIMSD